MQFSSRSKAWFLWLTEVFDGTRGGLFWETANSVTRQNVISFLVATEHAVLAQYKDFQTHKNSTELLKISCWEAVISGGKEEGTATASILLVSSWNSHAAKYFCSRPNRNISKFTQGTLHSLADASAGMITRLREFKRACSEVHVGRSTLKIFELGRAGLQYKKSKPDVSSHLHQSETPEKHVSTQCVINAKLSSCIHSTVWCHLISTERTF